MKKCIKCGHAEMHTSEPIRIQINSESNPSKFLDINRCNTEDCECILTLQEKRDLEID